MDETRHALLEHFRRFYSLIKAEEFDVGAFLSVFVDAFDCQDVCIFKLGLDARKAPFLHTIYWATGSEPLEDVPVAQDDVFSQILDAGDFVAPGCQFSTDECPAGLMDQGIKRCIIGPIDVVNEATLELIMIGTRQEDVTFEPYDLPLAEILSYFLSLKFVERRLQMEARILEMAGDYGFNLSLNHLRELHVDFDFLRQVRLELLRQGSRQFHHVGLRVDVREKNLG